MFLNIRLAPNIHLHLDTSSTFSGNSPPLSYDMATTKIQLSDLPEFRGAFSWDADILVFRIKAENLDYNQHDPATWPRMTAARFKEAFGSLRFGKSDAEGIPLGLAYDDEIAQQFGRRVSAAENIVAREEDSEDHHMNFRHYLFPYFYGPSGHVYPNSTGKGLVSSIRIHWILRVTGARPGRTIATAPGASTPDRRQTHSIPSSYSEAEDTPDPHAPPTSATQAYREVLEMMDQTSTSELTTLRSQVEDYEQALARQKELTAINEKEARYWKKEADHHKRCYGSLMDECHRARTKNEVLQDEMATLKQAVDEKGNELKASKDEASEAKQQVIQIWTKMKAAEQDGGKRKASEEGAGGGNKKAKTV